MRLAENDQSVAPAPGVPAERLAVPDCTEERLVFGEIGRLDGVERCGQRFESLQFASDDVAAFWITFIDKHSLQVPSASRHGFQASGGT